MPKLPNPDCITCAQLSAAKAIEVYGDAGKGCWDSRYCPKRRWYYRNRVGQTGKAIALEPPQTYFAVLYLYKEPGEKPLHALGAELWMGQQAIVKLEPVHCFGLTSGQIRGYSESVLQAFSKECGVKLAQFKDIFELNPQTCPLRPCPLHFRSSFQLLDRE
jgi:hypothetical protein